MLCYGLVIIIPHVLNIGILFYIVVQTYSFQDATFCQWETEDML